MFYMFYCECKMVLYDFKIISLCLYLHFTQYVNLLFLELGLYLD